MKRIVWVVLLLGVLAIVTGLFGVWPWTRIFPTDQYAEQAIVSDANLSGDTTATSGEVAVDNDFSQDATGEIRVEVVTGDDSIDTGEVVVEVEDEFDEDGQFDPQKFQDDDIQAVMDVLRELAE